MEIKQEQEMHVLEQEELWHVDGGAKLVDYQAACAAIIQGLDKLIHS